MIEKIILDTVSAYSLFKKGDVVTVALSGGADSVALLYALNQLKNDLGITLKAVHLNHQIRGDEALRDESFVKDFCDSLNIELICERIDVPQFAKSNNLSLETAARKARYNLFERVNEGAIATAHTASDNLETLLLNLARGTSLDGLCGIPVKRDYIVRPIISATREDIENYCKDNNLKFVTDSTNLTDDYTRNKIRHKIVPVLKEINPKAELSALKTSKSLTEASAFLKQEAK
nr:tRNA lysidine(34) synthetase TilS [Clostridia bacterium]